MAGIFGYQETAVKLNVVDSWNATTNTPNLNTINAVEGEAWVVSTAGTTSLGGIATWSKNDIVVKTTTGWVKVSAAAGSIAYGSLTGSIADQTDLQAALDLKTSKTYVDGEIANKPVHLLGDETVAGTKTFSSTPLIPTSAPTLDTQIAGKKYVDDVAALKANDNVVVKITGDQTVAGVKTLSSSPIVPTPTTDMQVSTKKYVDDVAFIKANDSAIVHNTGSESVAGIKTFGSIPVIPTGAPTIDGQVSNKKYVDDSVSIKANDNAVVKLTGNQTIAGIKTHSSFPVTPSSAPTTDYQTSNKKYVDDGLATKAVDSAVVHNSGIETIAGVKTFSSSPVVPTPTTDMQSSTKKYVDDSVSSKANDNTVIHISGNESVSGVKTFGSIPILPSVDPTLDRQAANKSYVDDGDLYHNSGPITQPNYTTGVGTITIADVNVAFFPSSDFSGNLVIATCSGNTFTITDGIESYLVADYNAGSPLLRIETDLTTINGSNIVDLIVLWRQGSTVHSIDQDCYSLGLANKIDKMIINTTPYHRYKNTGIMISESASPAARTVIVSSGIVFAGTTPVVVYAFNSSTDNLTLASVANGVWSYTENQTVYDAARYNPSTGPASLGNKKYATRWFYRSIGDVKQLFYVLGNSQYSSYSDAYNEAQPNISILLQNHCILVGRAIIQEGSTSGVTESSFGIMFNGTTVIAHNDTTSRDSPGNHAKLVPLTDSTTAIQVTKANGTSAIINVDSSNGKAQIGDIAGGNTTEFEADGTLKFNGNASVWNDITLQAVNLRNGNTPPVFAALQGGIYGLRFDAGVSDEVFGSISLPHDYKEGSDISFHVQWSPTTTNGGNIVWGLEYSIANPGATYPINITITTAPTAAPGIVNRHSSLAFANISGSGLKIDAVIQFRLYRQGTGTDTFTGNAFLASIGLHYEVDTIGSRSITTK